MKKFSIITLCSVLFLSLFSCVGDDPKDTGSNALAGKTFVLDKSSMKQDEVNKAFASELKFVSNSELKMKISQQGLTELPEVKKLLKKYPQLTDLPVNFESVSLTLSYTYDEASGVITPKISKQTFTALKNKIEPILRLAKAQGLEMPHKVSELMPMVEQMMKGDFKKVLEHLESIKYDKETEQITIKGTDLEEKGFKIVFLKK